MQHFTLPHLPAHAGDSTAKIFSAIVHKWACSEAIKTNTSHVTSNQSRWKHIMHKTTEGIMKVQKKTNCLNFLVQPKFLTQSHKW